LSDSDVDWGAPAPPRVTVKFRPFCPPGYAALVSLSGEHDLATTPELEATFASLHGLLLVDLSDCAFLDSTVMGVLLQKCNSLERDGHTLELVVPQTNIQVARTLETVGISAFLQIHRRLPQGASDSITGGPELVP
jgi:anti-anti-sigma factor